MAALGAALRGGLVERQGVALFAFGWMASLASQVISGDVSPGVWLALIDVTVLIALVSLTWKSPRPWPAIACGFQALAIATGLAAWINPEMDVRIHLSLLAVAGYGAAGALAIGAWRPPRQAQN